jgi:hypothetical protein
MADGAIAIPGAGGDSGGASPPVETTPVETVDTAVETPVETSVDPGVETSQTTEVESTDGRTIPLKYREIFKANPELRSKWFTLAAFNEQFPNVQAAKEAKELIELVGGQEGWQQIQEKEEQQRALDEKYYSRNPQGQREFVQNLITQDKSAFTSIVPVALNAFFEADPKAYNRVMSRVVANTFAGAFNRMGVQNRLAQAIQLLGTNPEQSKAILGEIAQWTGQFDEIANQQPEVDPEREAFEKEKNEFQTKKQREDEDRFQQSYKNSAGQKAGSATLTHISSIIGEAKFKSLDDESKGDLQRAIFQKINETAMKDQNYIRQMKAILARKDAAAAERYFLSKFNQLLPDAAKKVMRLFNMGGPAAKVTPKPGEPSLTPKAGWINLQKQPLPGQIDRQLTSDAMIMKGEAILKDGKKVRWPERVVA